MRDGWNGLNGKVMRGLSHQMPNATAVPAPHPPIWEGGLGSPSTDHFQSLLLSLSNKSGKEERCQLPAGREEKEERYRESEMHACCVKCLLIDYKAQASRFLSSPLSSPLFLSLLHFSAAACSKGVGFSSSTISPHVPFWPPLRPVYAARAAWQQFSVLQARL